MKIMNNASFERLDISKQQETTVKLDVGSYKRLGECCKTLQNKKIKLLHKYLSV